MFNRNSNHLQAIRVDHYTRRRSRTLSFSTLAVGIIVCSTILVWGLRSWTSSDRAHQPPEPESVLIANQDHVAPPKTPTAKPTNKADKSEINNISATMGQPQLRELVTPYIDQGIFPYKIDTDNQATTLLLDYTLDTELQDWAVNRLQHYKPDYGVFVALNPDTGKILALASSRRNISEPMNLASTATYPAASTIKLITAAAMIEEGKATPDTVYPLNGKSTSLYKKQVLTPKQNKWTRHYSLERAFAKSVNAIFGRIGLNNLGRNTLLKYAEQFGFNAQFMTDFEFDNGSMQIDLDDDWQVVESASGYTRRNTLSPIHGAVIAASVINGGYLIAPTIVNSVSTEIGGKQVYQSGEPRKLKVLSPDTVDSLQQLMTATVKVGTGHRTFRRFFRRDYEDVVIGGKTGHLRGNNPKGSYDWFIGYGTKNEKKIAFAMLCINTDKWYVKSSQFAREALEYYFKNPPKTPEKRVAGSQHETVS